MMLPRRSCENGKQYPYSMVIICFIAFIAEIVASTIHPEDYYCKFSKKHTMCNSKGFGAKCTSPSRLTMSKKDKELILHLHNQFRMTVANGKETRGKPGPQPPAANMEQMEWDDELATVAQKHADQCVFAHECSECRQIDRFRVGQNLYIGKQTIKSPPTNWTVALTAYYDEVSIFSRKWVDKFKFSPGIGHYSALMWAHTNKVGCGATEFREGKWYSKLYTCDYGPVGNYIDGQVYKTGLPCTACPSGTICSTEYKGLCRSSASGSTTAPKSDWTSNFLNTLSQSFIPAPTRFEPPTTTRTTTIKITTKRSTTPSTTTLLTTKSTTTTTRPNQTSQSTLNFSQILANILTSLRDSSKLFGCSIGYTCSFNASGKAWDRAESPLLFDDYYRIQLESNEETELTLLDPISKPKNLQGQACLTFDYKKEAEGIGLVPIRLTLTPEVGAATVANVYNNSGQSSRWAQAKVEFSNIKEPSRLSFTIKSPLGRKIIVALNKVEVREGKCSAIAGGG